MSRMERLIELMLRLQTVQHFTVQELADAFYVSRRTMLRDLQALSAIGVPLAATPGPHGGYVLMQKQQLLPLSLSEDEAVGVVLSYEALSEYADAPFAVSYQSATTKLRNALPPDVIQRLDALREHLVVSGTQHVYKAPWLTDILRASIDQIHLHITYESRSHVTERLIYPFGLYAFNGLWYCACFDYTRQQHISLRADRFLALHKVEGLETPSKMSLRQWLQTVDPDEEYMLVLQVAINKRGMKDVNWVVFHSDIAVHEDGSGTINKKISARELDFYARQLLLLGHNATIESPTELISVMRQYAYDILEHYKQ